MNNTAGFAISIQGITKSYGDTPALKGINFEVAKGELFGLIGPDGAGKTSLLRILTTLLLPDEGVALVDGLDVVKDYSKLRAEIGYMPGRFSLYQDLSVVENLQLFASIFGTNIEENYDQIKDIYSQLEPFKDRRAKDLSGGMKQKLALSCALVHQPSILFLDEPTTGVDPVSRREFWEILKRLKEKGITIMVSTPYMDEAGLCDRIALMQESKILSINTPAGILADFKRPLYGIFSTQKYELLRAFADYDHTYTAFAFGESIHYTDQRGEVAIDELEVFLTARNLREVRISRIQPHIEDCFMELMQSKTNG